MPLHGWNCRSCDRMTIQTLPPPPPQSSTNIKVANLKEVTPGLDPIKVLRNFFLFSQNKVLISDFLKTFSYKSYFNRNIFCNIFLRFRVSDLLCANSISYIKRDVTEKKSIELILPFWFSCYQVRIHFFRIFVEYFLVCPKILPDYFYRKKFPKN